MRVRVNLVLEVDGEEYPIPADGMVQEEIEQNIEDCIYDIGGLKIKSITRLKRINKNSADKARIIIWFKNDLRIHDNPVLNWVMNLNIETKDIEYVINGYSNSKEKVVIKQSKYHIIIEPNNNGFDKYLIQEIIQEYAKSKNLDIFKYKKTFKVVIINKIDC